MRQGARAKPKRASKTRATPPAAATRLTLAADCTLREAAGLKALLLSAVVPAGDVIIEGGAVERIDTAGLQLLVAFARREGAAGRRLAWQSVSAELRDAAARLGLLPGLGLESGSR